MSEEKNKLKPCPFCGGEAGFRNIFLGDPKVVSRETRGKNLSANFLKQEYHIECKKCRFSTRDYEVLIEIEDRDCLKLVGEFWENDTIIRLTQEWNRRAEG